MSSNPDAVATPSSKRIGSVSGMSETTDNLPSGTSAYTCRSDCWIMACDQGPFPLWNDAVAVCYGGYALGLYRSEAKCGTPYVEF